MTDLKDKSLDVIQRDRLSNFFKEADEKSSGCFYFSLANIYHFLNPGKLLPRNFEQEALKINPDLGVKGSEVFKRVSELRHMLGLEISEVIVVRAVIQDIDEIRNLFKVPKDISVKKPDEDYIKSPDKMTSMVYWQREDHHAHFSALNNARISWQDPDGSIFSEGGQSEVDLLGGKGFSAVLVFHFKKITP